MKRFEPVLEAERPEAVVVVGDVNSTVAAALVAAKMQIPVVHVEAGLRSFDRTMPEEINRLVTDAISDLLLVTEESGRTNLLREGVHPDKIHMVGNFMIDSLVGCLPSAKRSDVLERIGVAGTRFGLVTLHRPSNVDNAAQFSEILEALETVAADLPLVFPVHPRTRAQLNGHASRPDARIRFIDPLGYLDFLCLLANSSVVLTDSGGIQEETTALRVPCLTLRENTERPVTIEQGSNTLAGTSKETILEAWRSLREHPKPGRIPPLWDGGAARRAVQVLRSHVSCRAGSQPAAASQAAIFTASTPGRPAPFLPRSAHSS
jgi:UDP-N-acetylglucosamine 2-epimerase (non-hydrolysing)